MDRLDQIKNEVQQLRNNEYGLEKLCKLIDEAIQIAVDKNWTVMIYHINITKRDQLNSYKNSTSKTDKNRNWSDLISNFLSDLNENR